MDATGCPVFIRDDKVAIYLSIFTLLKIHTPFVTTDVTATFNLRNVTVSNIKGEFFLATLKGVTSL